MKYCPNCKRDFEDTATLCRWCELDLVAELSDGKKPSPEAEAEQEAFFEESGETVTVYTDFDPLQIRDIEAALKAKGIPVSVRPAEEETEEEPESEAEPSEEATEEEAEPEAEPAEETEKEPEKKGFLARFFGRKKTAPKEKTEDGYRFTRGGMLLDVVVPACFAEQAAAAVNSLLGISGATDDWHYEDAQTVSELLAEANGADYDEEDREPDELTHFVEEDYGEEY